MKKIAALVKNPVAINSGIMFVGTMAVNFGAYLYQVVVLRIMGPVQYSELAALFSILFILSVPAQVAQTVLTKFFSEKKAANDLPSARSLLIVTFKYLSIASVFGLVIYLPLVPVLTHSLKITSSLSVIGLYGIFVSVFFITGCVSALNGFQRFFPSTFFMTLSMVLRLLSGVLFASLGVAATVLGSAIANVLSFLLFLIPLKFLFAQKPGLFELKKRQTLVYALPTLFVLLGVTMMYNVDVVMVKVFFSAESAGIYGGLTIFGKIIFFAATAILLAVFPMVAEKKALKQAYQHLVWTGLAGITVMSLAIVAGYFLLAPVVTNVLFGPRFSGVVPFLGIFGIFMSAITVINYIGTISLAVHKTGVWKIIVSGALLQIAALTLFHETLYQVIIVNIIVSLLVAVSALLYYVHEPRNS